MLRLRKIVVRLVLGLFLIWAMLMFYSVRTQFYRAAIILTAVGILASLVVILWQHKFLRWVPISLPAFVAIFLLLPGRPVDPATLRQSYVAALQRYAGTRYVWGGENSFGVDCSGLLRTALVDAHARQAVSTFNPSLARQALWLWWHDASARDMLEGYQGLTTQLSPASPLIDVTTAPLLPGDFAVTADGSHVLAYAGQGRWIEADPYVLRVIEIDSHTDPNWHTIKVIACRWLCLGGQGQ